jgi:hypothetical protein
MPNRVAALTDALVFARGYTTALLDTLPPANWYRVDAPGSRTTAGVVT